jgi:membrane-associated phospholipid phosphatase
VESFDARLDGWLEHLRGNAVADLIFPIASELGDFSLIWQLINAGRGTLGEREADASLVFAALLGLESLTVNQGVKRAFHRRRPTEAGDPRYPVRRPSTSSFPSGHASAAFFAATIFIARDGRRSAPVWLGLAGIIASSRAFVRIHHPSDVVAGAAVGALLGQGALAIMRGLRN